MNLTKSDLKLPGEPLRLAIKQLAEESRYRFSKKGIVDIFDILEDVAFFIRKPLEIYEISGFTTYFNNEFVVFLNSSFTLGHERFTAAHELYHILYNSDILKKEKLLLNNNSNNIEDEKANVFASEFLMPEDYVKELFYKLINVDRDKLEVRHVVRLNSTLKVSYKAMLKRLVQLDLCDISLYESLVEYGTLEKKEELRDITKTEGYDISLIVPSNIVYVSKEYLEIAKQNYEKGKISYGKITQLLKFINETPEQYGYNEPEDDEIV
ncbi:ImmA/IrrE family metallo-endopeptidase [Clostridium algidicarnis]|uniref:ImmA/IrrE family metallo-endopeptidase n=1 Tax=Clostridium algidicarnis TaxID=37659 RepID=UPI001625FEDF|nr:ImmA/IrrE family metallo-endopeptidase [Clostridium algidicarnis]MBB6632063.1 ImmA/IrrE family metallo-endopeptidase [Clostridium algidicarnis]MBU3193722.1 ImmA/IrrE family metallo-endopeptidase [Clostridium algidicarnis]